MQAVPRFGSQAAHAALACTALPAAVSAPLLAGLGAAAATGHQRCFRSRSIWPAACRRCAGSLNHQAASIASRKGCCHATLLAGDCCSRSGCRHQRLALSPQPLWHTHSSRSRLQACSPRPAGKGGTGGGGGGSCAPLRRTCLAPGCRQGGRQAAVWCVARRVWPDGCCDDVVPQLYIAMGRADAG